MKKKTVTFEKVASYKKYSNKKPPIYVISDLDQKGKVNFNNYSTQYR